MAGESDKFDQIAEILKKNSQGFESIEKLLGLLVTGNRLSNLPQEELIAKVVRNYSEPYKVFTIDTSQAQAVPLPFPYKGGVFQVIDVTGSDLSAYINVQFVSTAPTAIPLYLGDRIVTPFNNIWISWPAQSGKIFKIAISQEFDNIFRLDKNFSGNLGSVATINNIPGLTSLPSGATQVHGSILIAGGAGSATTPIYTVTTGKTLYIQKVALGKQGSSNLARLMVTNGADVEQFSIARIVNASVLENFLPQIVVPSGYKIKLRRFDNADADNTADDVVGNFDGWEI